VQLSFADPVIDPVSHVSPVSMGTPVPLSATEVVPAFDALLAIVSCPLADPDPEGVNWMVIVELALAPTVIGITLSPLSENGCPDRLICDTSTDADPLLVRVITLLTVLPTATCPKLTVPVDTAKLPVADLCVEKEPEHPLKTRPQLSVNSPSKVKYKWRILPPNGRGMLIGARARFIAKANESNQLMCY
jgi:hypothetical protein